jgi:hypothetical protein
MRTSFVTSLECWFTLPGQPGTALTVPLMTWVVMPRVTRLLHRWLYPGPGAERHLP